MKVAPSILTADFMNLQPCIQMIESNADYLHLDIMDGSFVPNISFGFPVVESISKGIKIPMDAHLMVVEPQRWFKRLAELGVSMVSFHLETTGWKTASVIKAAKKCGLEVGIAINPDVPVNKLYKYIGKADFFLLMSVFAGFGGQKFIYETLDRVSALKDEMKKRGVNSPIQVDGGVNLENAQTLSNCGVDIVVVGSALLNDANPQEMIAKIHTL